MAITDFKNLRLPEVYSRNSRECYLDPIRQKLVYITLEETVRQRTISYLTDHLSVPSAMIIVEQHLSHYGIDTKRRADIVIHAVDEENYESPIAVVECKAPDIYLDEKTLNQMLDYADMLCVTYAMMINGNQEFCYKHDEASNTYIHIDEFPSYNDMISGKYQEYDAGEFPERIPFEQISEYLEEYFASVPKEDIGADIYRYTPREIAVPVFNFMEGLLDPNNKMPAVDYGLFRMIEDYGVRMLSYGNASGGSYYGPYRSFLVEINGNTEVYSIGVTTSFATGHPDKGRTCIVVAHDDEKESHHALQLSADDNLVIDGEMVRFYHNGKIGVGRIGSGKVDELRQFVNARCPELIQGKKFYLGSIKHDKLWFLGNPEVQNVIVNLIRYSIVRDEYRAFLKRNNAREGKV